MTDAKAAMYKTAIIATFISDTFRDGECVAVTFLRKTNGTRFFRCTNGERIEVLPEYDLKNFVL